MIALYTTAYARHHSAKCNSLLGTHSLQIVMLISLLCSFTVVVVVVAIRKRLHVLVETSPGLDEEKLPASERNRKIGFSSGADIGRTGLSVCAANEMERAAPSIAFTFFSPFIPSFDPNSFDRNAHTHTGVRSHACTDQRFAFSFYSIAILFFDALIGF